MMLSAHALGVSFRSLRYAFGRKLKSESERAGLFYKVIIESLLSSS